MKTLILVRHAKSSWKDASIDDHDRALNKRGEHDAPFMAKIFFKKKIKVDAIFSSTALRALTTAKEFAKAIGFGKENIILEKELYLAGTEELFSFVKNTDDKLQSIMLFGHNPVTTSFAELLTKSNFENVPTCGVVAIDFDIDSWKQVTQGNGKLRFFEFPKMYFKEVDD